MIGTYCKSFQHLEHYAENSKHKKCLLVQNNGSVDDILVFKTNKRLFIFNHMCGNVKETSKYTKEEKQIIDTHLFQYSGLACVEDNFSREWVNARFGNFNIILLPNDFFDKFDNFIKNNLKQYKQNISDKYGLDQSNRTLLFLFNICGESINFLSWAVKNVMAHNVPLYMIFHIMQWNEKYSQFSNKLKKGTITAYSGINQILQLVQELGDIRKDKRINDSVNQFNTAQKKILKEATFDSVAKTALNNFAKLSDVKRLNFIRKMSTVEDYSDIISQMASLCDVHFMWNKESVIKYITENEHVKCDIVLDKDNILLVTSKDYDTIKRLAKTTNWCISKNKRYWNDYIENKEDATQYVLFDFNKKEDDELSIVGFTVIRPQGITYAHSFTNQNLMGERTHSVLTSFVPVVNFNIFGILQNHNIPLDIFIKERDIPFEWNKEAFLKYLGKFINIDSIDIVYDNNNKFVFISNDYDIHRLFHKESFRHFDSYCFENKCIFFLDFNLNVNDRNKLLFSVIYNKDSNEEYGTNLYNFSLTETQISFDEKIMEYGLPYDIIKRVDNAVIRFVSSIQRYDIVVIKSILSDENKLDEIKKHKSYINDAFYSIHDSVLQHKSFDVLNAFYDSNVKFSDIFGYDYIENLIVSIYCNIYANFNALNRLPDNKDFDDLFNGKITNPNICRYVGFFKAFNLMFAHEDKHYLFKLTRNICSHSPKSIITEYFINLILSNINEVEDSKKDSILTKIAVFAIDNNLKDVTDRVKSIKIPSDLSEYLKNKSTVSKKKWAIKFS